MSTMPGLCCRALTTNICRLTIKVSSSNARHGYTCGGLLPDRTFRHMTFSVKPCACMRRPKMCGRTGMMKPCCGGIHARERSWPAALRNALSTISVRCWSSLCYVALPITGRMLPLSKLFDHFFVECSDVIRLAARDESHVGDDFFVDPIPARIPNVGTQRRPGGQSSAVYHASFHQHPRSVADRSDGLTGIKEVLHEFHSFRLYAQFLRIHNASGQQQCIKLGRVGGLEWNVNCNPFGPSFDVPAAYLSFLG